MDGHVIVDYQRGSKEEADDIKKEKKEKKAREGFLNYIDPLSAVIQSAKIISKTDAKTWAKVFKILGNIAVELLKSFTGITALYYGIKAIQDAKKPAEKVLQAVSLFVTVIPAVGPALRVLATGASNAAKLAKLVETMTKLNKTAQYGLKALKLNDKSTQTAKAIREAEKLVTKVEQGIDKLKIGALNDRKAITEAVISSIETAAIAVKAITTRSGPIFTRENQERLKDRVARWWNDIEAKEQGSPDLDDVKRAERNLLKVIPRLAGLEVNSARAFEILNLPYIELKMTRNNYINLRSEAKRAKENREGRGGQWETGELPTSFQRSESREHSEMADLEKDLSEMQWVL